jgi:hypothetical protein
MRDAVHHPTFQAAVLASVALIGALPACTHDFSVFEVSARTARDGSGSGGDGPSDGSSGGGLGSGAAGSGAGGLGSSGGAAGQRSSGGAAGSSSAGGASNAGDASNTGGKRNTGGRPGTGDAGTDADAGLRRCAAKYGAASGYVLCTETATTCRFFATTAGGTCNTLCANLGGTCSDQDNDDGVNPCAIGDPTDTCATPRTNAICVCAR